MNAGDHIGEFAALYALGTLDPPECDGIERHVAACERCALALAQAHDDVAAMAAAGPRYEPPRALLGRPRAPRTPRFSVTWLAVAAAFVAGLLPSAYFWQENRAMHATMSLDATAIERFAQTPVRTVAFSPMSGATIAHVMYPPDGSWYVVLVRGATKAFSVAWMHGGQHTVLGTARPHGGVAMLYLPKSHPMRQLALLQGRRVVAQAELEFYSSPSTRRRPVASTTLPSIVTASARVALLNM